MFEHLNVWTLLPKVTTKSFCISTTHMVFFNLFLNNFGFLLSCILFFIFNVLEIITWTFFLLISHVDLIQRITHMITSFWTGMLFFSQDQKTPENKNVLIELLNSLIPSLPVFNMSSIHILLVFWMIMRNHHVNKLQTYTNTQKDYISLQMMFWLFE